jgi:hypothetical protein
VQGLGGTASERITDVSLDSTGVLQWLVEAAEQLKTFSRYFLCDVHVKQLQLDELVMFQMS